MSEAFWASMPMPIGYALPTGIAPSSGSGMLDPGYGLQQAQASQQQVNASNAYNQAVGNYGQDVFAGVTGNLTKDPARYAGISAAYQGQVGPSQPEGTYSPGSGLSSYSGTPLDSPAPSSVFDTGTSAVPYAGYAGSLFSKPSYPGIASPYAQGMVGPSASASAEVPYTPPPAPPPPTSVPSTPSYQNTPFSSAYPSSGVGSNMPTAGYSDPRDSIASALMAKTGTAGTGYAGSSFADRFAPAAGLPSSFADRFNAAPSIPSQSPGLPPDFLQPSGPQIPYVTAPPPEPPAPTVTPPNVANAPSYFDAVFNKFPTPQAGSFADRYSAAPTSDPNSFANRFADYPNAGSPSQYYYGSQYGGPSKMPPGYASPFSVDNPSGSLPIPGTTSGTSPGSGSFTFSDPTAPPPPPSQDTLLPQDRFRPPVMNAGQENDFYPPFNDPTYFGNAVSPASGYSNFQKPLTEVSAPTVVGTASTYDPTASGWRTGGPETASGQMYDPNKFSAAIQTSLRNRFAGVPYGQAPTSGLVESPSGQQAVVDVNDVGPLVQNRVMDLSTAAMKYFNPSSSPNSGTVPNMQIQPLPSYFPPGPVGPVGPYGPNLPTAGIPLPNMQGPTLPYTPTTGFVKR